MQNEEQEIDLVEYVKLLIKHKRLILSVLVISLIIGAITYIKDAEKYEVAMIVKIKDATLTAKEISENINAGIFSDIIKNVNLNPGEIVLSMVESTESLVKISAKIENKNIAAATVALNAIYDKLYKQNKEYIEEKKESLILQEAKKQKRENKDREINNKKVDLKIKLLNMDINNNKERISSLEEEMKKLDVNRLKLAKEYEQAKNEYDNYIKDKEKYMEPKSGAVIGLAAYYSQVVAGKLQDVNYLRAQIDLLKKNESDMSSEIKMCKRNIESTLIEIKMTSLAKIPIEDLEKIDSTEGLTDIKLQQEPITNKIKANKRLILMISVLGGFMVGILLAFSIEFLKRIKRV